MNHSTISADIISFTSLGQKDKREIEQKIQYLLEHLAQQYSSIHFYGRIVQGDTIECAMTSPTYALRVALLLKTYIKSIELSEQTEKDNRVKYFKEYGVRAAIAVAPLSVFDDMNGIIDGEAIYMSGRAIKHMSTSNKQKIVVKDTLFFRSKNEEEQEKFESIFSLLDAIISKCSQKQSEVLFYKLSGLNEKEISLKMNRNQSTISQHSSAASWNAIEKSVNYFEKYIQ